MDYRKIKWRPKSLLVHYLIAFAFGMLAGYKVIPVPVTAITYLIIAALSVFYAIQGNLYKLFVVLPYAVYLEVFVRGYAKWVPYLTLQYTLILCFTILLLKGVRGKKSHFPAFFLLVLYTVLELINNVYPDKPDIGRAIMVQSLALLMAVVWASYNVLKPMLINKLLNNIKIACIMLAGMVFVAHLTDKIDYGLHSSSDASNGLAPVQLSGYMGVGCVLLFLSIMNPEELHQRLANIIVLALTATVMVLTFSRGGLYFMSGIIILFFYYNRAKMGNYLVFVLLIPVAVFIYSYVVNQTGGKILERYKQEGASSREDLIKIGFQIFFENPVFGVGTGNYNTTIVKKELFPVESGAHNEFVRAAAEHGLIGMLLYWGFFLMLFLNILRRKQPERQYAMYFIALFCMISVHNGLKISVQPLLVMLAVATPAIMYKKPKNVFNRTYVEATVA